MYLYLCRMWTLGCVFQECAQAGEQLKSQGLLDYLCWGRSTRYIGNGHPNLNRNLDNGYISPYYSGQTTLIPKHALRLFCGVLNPTSNRCAMG